MSLPGNPFRSARAATLASLGLASGFCIALVAARVLFTSHDHLAFLAWNLVLAWVPLVLALAVYDRAKRGGPAYALVLPGLLWLLFFPNAPYIVTDFVHLGPKPGVPLWYDAMTLAAFASTGLLLGFTSLYLMQIVVRRRLGQAAGWLFVLCALALSSFGIYLGRDRRWNSWDVFTEPNRLFADVWSKLADPLGHPKTVAMTLAFTCFLTLTYAVLYNFARLDEGEARAGRGR